MAAIPKVSTKVSSSPAKVSLGNVKAPSVSPPKVAPLKQAAAPKMPKPPAPPKAPKGPSYRDPNRAMYAQDLPKPQKG